jgi:hypothetical protein
MPDNSSNVANVSPEAYCPSVKNPFGLLIVEVREARERLLHAIVLALGVAALGLLPGLSPLQESLSQGLNFVVSFGFITLLFAMIFKLLPDVKSAWRDVWIGTTCPITPNLR